MDYTMSHIYMCVLHESVYKRIIWYIYIYGIYIYITQSYHMWPSTVLAMPTMARKVALRKSAYRYWLVAIDVYLMRPTPILVIQWIMLKKQWDILSKRESQNPTEEIKNTTTTIPIKGEHLFGSKRNYANKYKIDLHHNITTLLDLHITMIWPKWLEL